MAITSLIQERPSPKMDVIFDALIQGWPGAKRNVKPRDMVILWGLIGDNQRILLSEKSIFVDMPYFHRWLPGQDLEKSNWRFIAGGVHNGDKLNVTIDRFESFNIKVKPWQMNGEHILVCPSSNSMTLHLHGMTAQDWVDIIVKRLKEQTNRPIRVRHKPRKNGTSGPSVADTPIEKDLEGCYALVTSGSLTAVDALINGVPVFSSSPNFCPAAWCTNLSDIENIKYFDRESLFANLAWKQFSIDEMKNGFCHEHFTRFYNNQSS